MDRCIAQIEEDLKKRLAQFREEGRLLEAQRLEQRTHYDIEMLKEIGYCSGIENYSRYFDGRQEGEPPFTLMDYFPKDFLVFIDESHVTVPQIRAHVQNGDYARKRTLIDYGFRLPAAFDNRPLKFHELRSASAPPSSFQPPPGLTKCSAPSGWWNRSSGPRGCWIRRSSCVRRTVRWTT